MGLSTAEMEEIIYVSHVSLVEISINVGEIGWCVC